MRANIHPNIYSVDLLVYLPPYLRFHSYQRPAHYRSTSPATQRNAYPYIELRYSRYQLPNRSVKIQSGDFLETTNIYPFRYIPSFRFRGFFVSREVWGLEKINRSVLRWIVPKIKLPLRKGTLLEKALKEPEIE